MRFLYFNILIYLLSSGSVVAQKGKMKLEIQDSKPSLEAAKMKVEVLSVKPFSLPPPSEESLGLVLTVKIINNHPFTIYLAQEKIRYISGAWFEADTIGNINGFDGPEGIIIEDTDFRPWKTIGHCGLVFDMYSKEREVSNRKLDSLYPINKMHQTVRIEEGNYYIMKPGDNIELFVVHASMFYTYYGLITPKQCDEMEVSFGGGLTLYSPDKYYSRTLSFKTEPSLVLKNYVVEHLRKATHR